MSSDPSAGALPATGLPAVVDLPAASAPAVVDLPATVRAAALGIHRPTYLYDLADLDRHLAGIRAALPTQVELLYALKANPDRQLVDMLARHVSGVEVSSAGELRHLATCWPGGPAAAFGGPGKTDSDLAAGLAAGVSRFHVESRTELRRLDALARKLGRVADILLRVNPPTAEANPNEPRPANPDSPEPAGLAHPNADIEPGGLVMGGQASPFGMDPADAEEAVRLLPMMSGVRLRGIHMHLASGLDAPSAARIAYANTDWVMRFAQRHALRMTDINVGGGMAVDYARPAERFDWAGYGTALGALCRAYPRMIFRIEPGRSLVAYCGYYATPVIDVKRSHGRWFAVVAGGTHHLRTPAAKQHNQPLAVLNRGEPNCHSGTPVTVVGQLCTPKDVLARDCPSPVAPGDVIVFAMAGGYAWNISHHDFLMHPHPDLRYLSGGH